jgi:hypothetical protein
MQMEPSLRLSGTENFRGKEWFTVPAGENCQQIIEDCPVLFAAICRDAATEWLCERGWYLHGDDYRGWFYQNAGEMTLDPGPPAYKWDDRDEAVRAAVYTAITVPVLNSKPVAVQPQEGEGLSR